MVLALSRDEIDRIEGALQPRSRSRWSKTKWYQTFKRSGERCVACGEQCLTELTIDHIVPLSRGGGNNKENLQILCSKCNQEKGNLTMEEWRQEGEDDPTC